MRGHRFGLPITIVACLLTACGAAPSREAIEADVDQAVESETPVLPEQWGTQSDAGVVQAGWIEIFNDPALTRLVTEAQTNNRDLAAAAANVDRAWALARQAGAVLSPDISLAATGGRSGSSDSSSPTTTKLSLGLQVSWEADLWGRLRAGQRGAVASAQAVEADYRFAQYSLAAATAKAYFTSIEAKFQADIARETVEILEETQRIVNVKHDNGMASAQDVSLTRSDLASARERLTTVDGSFRDALRALEVLLGRSRFFSRRATATTGRYSLRIAGAPARYRGSGTKSGGRIQCDRASASRPAANGRANG
jgi:outer membrane protein TolC